MAVASLTTSLKMSPQHQDARAKSAMGCLQRTACHGFRQSSMGVRHVEIYRGVILAAVHAFQGLFCLVPLAKERCWLALMAVRSWRRAVTELRAISNI